MFMTPLCWEHWLPWFEAKGYRCLAPAWPGRDRPAADLRAANPDTKLGRLTLGEVVDRFAGEVAALQEKPILIGHAMGGLITQILVSRDVAAAGIAIHSAPPPGVFTLNWSYLRSNWGLVGPFADMRAPKTLTFEEFQRAFASTLPLEAQWSVFDRHIVPDSPRVARDAQGEFAPHRFRQAPQTAALDGGRSGPLHSGAAQFQ
jgi:pimeloyl-ACP methyl ester carboxylesterase